MPAQEPLGALETIWAAEALHDTLTENPDGFPAALKKAAKTHGLTLEEAPTTVAYQWALNHSGRLTNDEQVAKVAANSLLSQADLLGAMGAKLRFFIAETLFPFFDLPAGWRLVAEKAGFTGSHIATFITNRVMAIKSREDAEREMAFIRQILTVPDDEAERYLPLMDKKQLNLVAARLWHYAHDEMAKVRDTRSMMWRHRLWP